MPSDHQHAGGQDDGQMNDHQDDDLKEQVAQLRAQLQQVLVQVDQMMRDHVTPGAADVAGRAEEAVLRARDFTQAKIEAVSEDIREWPLTALLLAAGVGYVAGRISR
jgi:ElaB/YqjD/DUF883 family membrane-anchored ribosome-binding protein